MIIGQEEREILREPARHSKLLKSMLNIELFIHQTCCKTKTLCLEAILVYFSLHPRTFLTSSYQAEIFRHKRIFEKTVSHSEIQYFLVEKMNMLNTHNLCDIMYNNTHNLCMYVKKLIPEFFTTSVASL